MEIKLFPIIFFVSRYAAASVLSPTDDWMIAGGYQNANDYYNPIDTAEKVSNGQFVSGEKV